MMRPTALALLFFASACADRGAAPGSAPAAESDSHRIRLFDRMDRATLETPPALEAAPAIEAASSPDAGDRALEPQRAPQGDGSNPSRTDVDDPTADGAPLTGAALWAQLRERHAPRDGQQASTPWRIRAALPRAGVRAEEVRDAVLLPPPSTLSFPLVLPPAETAPRLRFRCGMLPEAFDVPGDGARITVRFRPDGGEAVEVGAIDFDPKQNAEDRGWRSVALDLTAHGGEAGVLSFESRDVAGSPKDALDAVVLATPRIEPATAAPDDFNVLLIGIDTLRADRVSAHGYERPTTPNLERLAREGIRFQKTRSQAPWTLPSFASILTSLYPSAHGAGRGGHGEWTGVDPGTASIAELLARAGYETHGIVSNVLMSPKYGLDQGFEGYRFSWARESAKGDAALAAEFIDAHRSTPWLLFWHVMDPHLPYATEPSYWQEYTAADYAGRFSARRSVPTAALHEPGRRAFEGPTPAPELSDADRRFVSDLYDAEIAETDAAIGRVIDALIASGQWERTIVAVVGDHGEALGERGHYHHGHTLYDDQVHVPMLLRIPGRDEGRVVDAAVASIDLAPTLLGVLGLERPDDFHGADLTEGDFADERPYFIESPTYDSSAQKAWVQGNFKYLHDPVFGTEALFDLASDPGEVTDVAEQHPELVQRARRELEQFRWEQLQRGRYHLRVAGQPGQRLTVAIGTDDVFDANFASQPATPEADVALDLDRRSLAVDTTMEGSSWELVFWGRGDELTLDVRLDGQPLADGVLLGSADEPLPLPATLARDGIPTRDGAEARDVDVGRARLWLDGGASTEGPTRSTPDEIELLRQLGYVR